RGWLVEGLHIETTLAVERKMATIRILFIITTLIGLHHCFTDFEQVGLDIHNKHRAHHRVPLMTLANDLNKQAAGCAKYYMDHDTIDHSCKKPYGVGQNLYYSRGRDKGLARSVGLACEAWYNEIVRYNFKDPDSNKASHATQLIWKASTELGIGVLERDARCIVVALYRPWGNTVNAGYFERNIIEPTEDSAEQCSLYLSLFLCEVLILTLPQCLWY
ncbi:unnamed protein product, partial [Allacma fusca]